MDWHIWDKSCPTVQITMNPPGFWGGSVSDSPFGACFASRTFPSVSASFQNLTTGLYHFSGQGYSQTSRWWISGGFSNRYSNATSCGAAWSTPYPPLTDHVRGHS